MRAQVDLEMQHAAVGGVRFSLCTSFSAEEDGGVVLSVKSVIRAGFPLCFLEGGHEDSLHRYGKISFFLVCHLQPTGLSNVLY